MYKALAVILLLFAATLAFFVHETKEIATNLKSQQQTQLDQALKEAGI